MEWTLFSVSKISGVLMLCKWTTGARDRNLECQVLWLQCEMKVGHPGAEFFNSTESAPTSISHWDTSTLRPGFLTMTSPTGAGCHGAGDERPDLLLLCRTGSTTITIYESRPTWPPCWERLQSANAMRKIRKTQIFTSGFSQLILAYFNMWWGNPSKNVF